jgi:hypothetical protein
VQKQTFKTKKIASWHGKLDGHRGSSEPEGDQ